MARIPEQPGDPSLDDVTAERLLRGQRPKSGAPAGEQALSDLLAAASAPPSARELSGEARAVAAFTASRPATTGPRHARHVIRRRRSAMRPRVSHGVAAAAALGALTLGGVAAAAYTGSLPSSIQRVQLCTAYVSARMRGDQQEADKAMRRLENAAGGPDKVFAYCASVWASPGPGNYDPHDSAYPNPWPTRTAPASPDGRPPN